MSNWISQKTRKTDIGLNRIPPQSPDHAPSAGDNDGERVGKVAFNVEGRYQPGTLVRLRQRHYAAHHAEERADKPDSADNTEPIISIIGEARFAPARITQTPATKAVAPTSRICEWSVVPTDQDRGRPARRLSAQKIFQQIGARSSQLQQRGSSHSLRARYIERQEGHSIAPAPAVIATQFGRRTARPRKTDWRMNMARKMCEVCRIMPASAFIDVVECGQRRKLPVCNSHRTRLYGPSDDELAVIEADVRLDAELADSFPASDPPSILRGGLKDA